MPNNSSLEHINTQFKDIMDGMGIDREKQTKLSAKLDLHKKIRTIVSIQTIDERKRKIVEYLSTIKERQSTMNLLSLACSIETGPKSLYNDFIDLKGPNIIVESMKDMEGDYSYAMCDFLYTLLAKYDCEFPKYIEILLKKYLEQRFKCDSFFKILEYIVVKDKYEVLFENINFNKCLCSTYFSLIFEDIRKMSKIDCELNFVRELLKTNRSVDVKYLLFVGNFYSLEANIANKNLYSEISKIVKPTLTKNCRSNKIFEILRIAEKKNMLETISCIVESFVLGDKEIFRELEASISQMTIQGPKDETPVEPKKADVPPPVQNNEVPKIQENKPKPKMMMKIIKKKPKAKSVPKKNYVQVQWNKIDKGKTFWKDVDVKHAESLFKDDDFLEFEKKIEVKVKPQHVEQNVRNFVFPDKKNNAINIALGRIKISDYELIQNILAFKLTDNDNLIHQLLTYFPTSDELEKLSNKEELCGRAETFFKEASGCIDDFKNSLYFLNFRFNLIEQNFTESLSILKSYYTVLCDNRSFRNLLGVLLYIGNTLNLGTFLGAAEAFSLDSVRIILDTKSVSTRIIDLVKTKIDLAEFLHEFKIVKSIRNTNYVMICSEIVKLKSMLERITLEGKVEKEFDLVKDRYNSITGLHEEVVSLYEKCCIVYGEKIDDRFNSTICSIYVYIEENIPVES